MKVTATQLNRFLVFKLPAAFISGVRVRKLTETESIVTVRHRWINQNPFKSLYFAVQSMAAELSTAAFLIKKIADSGEKISMLVTYHKGSFTKKATGLITFSCTDVALLDETIKRAIETKEGQTILMKSVGRNEDLEQVSEYEFEWSIKVRAKS